VTQARRWFVPVLVAALFVLATLPTSPASAASVETSGDTVSMPDPASITFALRVQAAGGLREAVLNYRVLNPTGNVGGSVRPEVHSTPTQELRATLATNDAQRFIPVGSTFVYAWSLTDADGVVHTTEERTFVFLDGRYQWQAMTEDLVTVYWYHSESVARDVLLGSLAAVRLNEELLRTTLTYPVVVVLYRNSGDASGAQNGRGGTYDEETITGGARVATALVHVYHPLGSYAEVARHEIAHIMTKVAGVGSFPTMPSWLDEGVAVYSQADPGAGYRSGVEQAIRADDTFRLRSLQGPVNESSLVNKFYGLSWATVDFMIEEYGRDAFADLFALLKAGESIDAALTRTYGFDQDGLYNEWRESVGLARLEFAALATPIPQAEATRAPLGIPTSVAGGASTAGTANTPAPADGAPVATAEGSSNTVTAAIIGVVTLLLAGGLGGVGLKMMRRKA
jgi:hypothetical protein